MAVDVTVTKGVEESCLLLLVPHATIDDEFSAIPQGLGEAGGGVGALLVTVVERRAGAAAGGDEFVETDRGIDQAATGEAELLIVAGKGQEGGEAGCGVVDVADPGALVEGVVGAVAVGFDAVAVERRRPRPEIGRGGD